MIAQGNVSNILLGNTFPMPARTDEPDDQLARVGLDPDEEGVVDDVEVVQEERVVLYGVHQRLLAVQVHIQRVGVQCW